MALIHWPLEKVRSICLDLPEAVEEFPFDPVTHVFRIGAGGKMFALCDPGVESINLKVDPPELPLLLEAYPGIIQRGYRMNKDHWMTLAFDDGMPDAQIIDFIHESYERILASLKKAERLRLQPLYAAYRESRRG